VVQGASNEPLGSSSKKHFYKFAELLATKIVQSGAKTALFMTWAYRDRPGMTAQLRNAYVNAGNEIGAIVVPVGLAWERVLKNRSNVYLYDDRKHPTIQGTYLAACVFYASLFGRSPEGIQYTAGLPQEEALYMQSVAWETVVSFYNL